MPSTGRRRSVTWRRWSALALSSIPFGPWSSPAGSIDKPPCNSTTVVPEQQPRPRADCAALWKFYSLLTDRGNLDWGPGKPLSGCPAPPPVARTFVCSLSETLGRS